MASAANLSTRLFVSNVALFGSQISQVLHNFVSLEGCTAHVFRVNLKNLDATVHALKQLSSLIDGDRQETSLFSDEGLKYVETLTEECSVTMNTLKILAGGEGVCEYSLKNWKSVSSVDEKGHKVFVVPELDEVAIFQDLKKFKKSGGRFGIHDLGRRFEELQLLLLLVVQVVTVRDMTNKLSSGDADLKGVVEYHNRLKRAAEKARLSHRSGRVLSARSRSRSRRYNRSPSSSSGSDSEGSMRSRSRSPRRKTFRSSPPPPPPPGWRGPPPCPMPPVPRRSQNGEGFMGPPANGLPNFPLGSPPQGPFPRVIELEIDSTKTIADHHPPSYTEKEKASTTPNTESEKTEPSKDELSTRCQDPKSEEADVKIQRAETIKQPRRSLTADIPLRDDARLLQSSSTFGLKFKSLFRSKSSLEAEMKRTLADANASLTAFIVQHAEVTKIPHSAFHSLEYTHMRTILSQLKDDTWFKAFYDMTDAEHESLAGVMEDRVAGGRCYKRELVVLKVLQQNRFNAWARVIEKAFRSSRGIQHYENYRIILAIVREKDSGVSVIEVPPTPPVPARVIERYPPPNAPHVPNPWPRIPSDGKMIVDLEHPPITLGMGRCPPPSSSFEPPRPMPFRGPPPFPPQQYGSSQNPVQLDVTPRNPMTEESARETLLSYTAYTLRPAPVQQSPVGPLGEERPSSWVRCYLTREHESRSDLLQRIEKFKKQGIPIIDHKLQLTEPQSSQITRLVEDVNRLEPDRRFEHKIVELSMVDRVQGVLVKLLPSSDVYVIQLIIQRALKDGHNPLTTYDNLMRYPVSRGPPPPPPPPPVFKPKSEAVIVYPSRARSRKRGTRRRSLSTVSSSSGNNSDLTHSESGSDSSLYTVISRDSGPGEIVKRKYRHRYASSIGSKSSSDEVTKPRWKVDPIKLRFSRKEVGNDIVQLLLDRWTPLVGFNGKKKEGTESVLPKTRAMNGKNKATVEDLSDDD